MTRSIDDICLELLAAIGEGVSRGDRASRVNRDSNTVCDFCISNYQYIRAPRLHRVTIRGKERDVCWACVAAARKLMLDRVYRENPREVMCAFFAPFRTMEPRDIFAYLVDTEIAQWLISRMNLRAKRMASKTAA